MNALPPNVAEKRNSRLLTVSTKVSLTDLSALEEKASEAGLTLSSYVRQAAVAGQIQPRTVIQANPKTSSRRRPRCRPPPNRHDATRYGNDHLRRLSPAADRDDFRYLARNQRHNHVCL